MSKNTNNLKLNNAKEGEVLTRFPPEASGYIHIGHAKAALINFLLAQKYKGRVILRFDDTNCDKENVDYEHAIIEDLEALQIKFDIGPTFTSDYFPQMLEYAEQLIKNDKAYCDNTPKEEMQKLRFDGIATPCRDNSVEKNLAMWKEMQNASEEGLKYCLRAKLSVNNPNKCLRDPVLYRCNLTPHPRTGAKYKVYPTYDFACPIVDSLEGVTHALRTSEYKDRNDQYKWVCKALGIRLPDLDDYSRLNMEYTVMSKRKLTEFVETGRVGGWDDPRMPTVRGLLRRGLAVEALVEFVKVVGMSKVQCTMEWGQLWNTNKRILDPIAPRYTAVDEFRVPASIEGVDKSTTDDRPLHKKNTSLGNKKVTFSPKIFLEEQDCVLLKEGEEITLMDWGNAFVTKINKNGDKITSLELKLHLEGDFKTTEQKLSWLADETGNVPVEMYEYDHLITERDINKETNLDSVIRERTEYKLNGIAEPAIRGVKKGDIIQFSRRAFCICDAVEPVYKFIVIPDGHLKHNHLSAMARWGPPPVTLEERRKAAQPKDKKEAEGSPSKSETEKKPKKQEPVKAEAGEVKTKVEKPKAEKAEKAEKKENTKEEKKEKKEKKEKDATEGGNEGEEKEGESKKALKKKEKEEAKKAAAAARDAEAAAKAAAGYDKIKDRFGEKGLVQSTSFGTKFTEVYELGKALEGQEVLIRGRVHTVRAKGSMGFVVLRHTPYTVQCVLAVDDNIPKEAVQWVGKLRSESVVDLRGKVVCPPAPVTTVTQQDVEIQISSVFIVSSAPEKLPFLLDDASRRDLTDEELKEAEAKAIAEGKKGALTIGVAKDNRLNCRWLDNRTKANHALFNLQHRVSFLFREYLENHDFMEIHSPKIISTASEGGANVFKLGYFGGQAYLAQSPQLYKQMALQGDFHKVYEIGPVFRAENSNTHRHLTEFVGLDVEFTIKEHYFEVLNVAEELFIHIFSGLNNKFRHFLDMVREQYPFEDLVFQVPEETIMKLGVPCIEGGGPADPKPNIGRVRNMKSRVLRLPFSCAVELINARLPELRALTREQLLEQYGIITRNEEDKVEKLKDMPPLEDLSTQNEKLLGKIVKEKYGVDFFLADQYPSAARPFYTMPSPENPDYTNSYDIFIRGEEIVSGAQRVHDADLLLQRSKSLGVDLTPIKDYVDSFRLGAYPHGGFGVGLERVVMLFLGLKDIRYASLYPRDPTRTTP